MNRRGIEQSFIWIFALLIGAFILFLAIYASTQLIGLGNTRTNTETAKYIEVLLNPLESSFESGRVASISIPGDTRIYATCSQFGTFGAQGISTTQKRFGTWSEPNEPITFANKYVFAEKPVEGRDFVLFSKPISFSFKVADAIYLLNSTAEYCFVNAPQSIAEEISTLSIRSIKTESCSLHAIRVCFSGTANCAMRVDYGAKYVLKGNAKLSFDQDSLMYAAIFSTPEVYECQVVRLMKRLDALAKIYTDTANSVSAQGCATNVRADLLILSTSARSVESSSQLPLITLLSKKLSEVHDAAQCRLW